MPRSPIRPSHGECEICHTVFRQKVYAGGRIAASRTCSFECAQKLRSLAQLERVRRGRLNTISDDELRKLMEGLPPDQYPCIVCRTVFTRECSDAGNVSRRQTCSDECRRVMTNRSGSKPYKRKTLTWQQKEELKGLKRQLLYYQSVQNKARVGWVLTRIRQIDPSFKIENVAS